MKFTKRFCGAVLIVTAFVLFAFAADIPLQGDSEASRDPAPVETYGNTKGEQAEKPAASIGADREAKTNEEAVGCPPGGAAGTTADTEKSLYVLTYPCPPEVTEHMQETLYNSFYGATREGIDYFGDTEIKIGHPFTYSEYIPDMFIFPIYADGKMIYTYRVRLLSDGRAGGALSDFLTEELNGYQGHTSAEEPLHFYIEDRVLYGAVGDQVKELARFAYDSGEPEEARQREEKSAGLIVLDLSEPFTCTSEP